MRYVISIPLLIACSVVLAFSIGCESEAGKDAAIGGALGAGVGAIVGHQSGHTTEGALIGGAVGAGGGYILGNEKDKKQQQQAQTNQPAQSTDVVTVNITNSNGSVTPVKLTRSGTNYIGPKGEVYDHLPTEAELKPVYGF